MLYTYLPGVWRAATCSHGMACCSMSCAARPGTYSSPPLSVRHSVRPPYSLRIFLTLSRSVPLALRPRALLLTHTSISPIASSPSAGSEQARALVLGSNSGPSSSTRHSPYKLSPGPLKHHAFCPSRLYITTHRYAIRAVVRAPATTADAAARALHLAQPWQLRPELTLTLTPSRDPIITLTLTLTLCGLSISVISM